MLGFFEHNLRAHLEHKPMRNVASLPVPSSVVPTAFTSPIHANSVTVRSSNIVYAVRERSSGNT